LFSLALSTPDIAVLKDILRAISASSKACGDAIQKIEAMAAQK
jgi:hypothetical protein